MQCTKGLIGIITMLGLMLAGWSTASGDETAPPEKGSVLPALQLAAPASQPEADYLGLGAIKPFRPSEIQADLIVMEIIGVYCPQCHRQRPHINRLYHRLQKDPDLARKVKFIGIAAGATAMETAYLTREFHVPYPILTDETYEIHKQLGEPRTPFNMVVTRQGKVLWAHLGVIDDMNAFFNTIKSLAGR